MIADTAWLTQGIWGDENTPEIMVEVETGEGMEVLVYRQGMRVLTA